MVAPVFGLIVYVVLFTVNSYLGILSHSASYNLRCEIFDTEDVAKIVEFDGDMLTCRAA